MTEPRRRFAIAIAAALFFITAAAFLRPPLLPEMGRDLSLSALGLGALGSVFALGRLVTDVPAGRLSDRLSPGRMMAIAGVLVAIGSVILASAPNSLVAFGAVLVLGVGSAWTLTTAQAYYANAPRARRGAAMSVFAGSLLTAQAIGPALGGFIGSAAGWRVAVGFGAVLALGVVLPLFLIPSPPAAGHHGDKAGSGAGRPVPRRVLAVIYLLPAVQFSIGAALAQTLVPIIADEDLGLDVGLVGLALGIGGLARLAGSLTAGRIMDQMGRRAALIPGLVITVAGVAIFTFVPGLAAWWATIALTSFGSISVNVGTALLADLSEGGRLGPRLGSFRFTGDAAFLVAPLLSGWLLEESGRLAATLPLLALSGLVLLGSILWIPETHTGGRRSAIGDRQADR
ncbi:MAG TPA: MFS transporter [Acidimicrobiia bacterium]